jgi:hypothetical protein
MHCPHGIMNDRAPLNDLCGENTIRREGFANAPSQTRDRFGSCLGAGHAGIMWKQGIENSGTAGQTSVASTREPVSTIAVQPDPESQHRLHTGAMPRTPFPGDQLPWTP